MFGSVLNKLGVSSLLSSTRDVVKDYSELVWDSSADTYEQDLWQNYSAVTWNAADDTYEQELYT